MGAGADVLIFLVGPIVLAFLIGLPFVFRKRRPPDHKPYRCVIPAEELAGQPQIAGRLDGTAEVARRFVSWAALGPEGYLSCTGSALHFLPRQGSFMGRKLAPLTIALSEIEQLAIIELKMARVGISIRLRDGSELDIEGGQLPLSLEEQLRAVTKNHAAPEWLEASGAPPQVQDWRI